MIRFSFNIGCSESKVIFKWRKKKQTGKKALRLEHFFSLSQNSLSDKQTQSEQPALSLR